MNKAFVGQLLTIIELNVSAINPIHSQQEDESASSAGAASDPTAAVNFQERNES